MTTDDLFSPKAAAKAANVPLEKLQPNPKGRLKEQFHEVARFKHLSPRSEQSYWEWVVRYLKFHREQAGVWRHPRVFRCVASVGWVSGAKVSGRH